jgi:ferredoxin
MIFYITGTGNSLQAAKAVADYNNDSLISIADAMRKEDDCLEYMLKENEIVGFVYPVYAWGPPQIVLQFINKIWLKNYKGSYIFSIAVCGDNIGNTMKVLDVALKKKGMQLDSGFSVIMPNNYIVGFDVDSKELENKKLQEAEKTLDRINGFVKERKSGIFEVVKGPFPWVLTSVINPLFNKKDINPKKFYANDSCTGCGICERVCNTGNIKVDEKPKWGEHCIQCLACIHICPTRAIQYGKGTEKKGRYINPNVNIVE